MMAIEETTMTNLLAGESNPIYMQMIAEFGDPVDYARKAAEEYDAEHPKPKPPTGKNGVAYSTKSAGRNK